jgi:two-component system alkaline phosphatase synthesis response regulator PhoP
LRDRILIVDDEDYIRRLVSFVLEKAGYDVLVAATVEEGLRLLREELPDAVTIDLMMPEQGGLDLLAEKQADARISHIPSLVVTAVGIRADLDRAVELGATATLNKPFSHRQLIDAIEGILSS